MADYVPSGAERRKFPRIMATCPVRYTQQIENNWDNAELYDYSATGLRMVCDRTLLQDTKINLELIPGKMVRIPKIAAEAVVVRCGLRDDHRYEIACKLTKVRSSKIC
jgi:hypothetical protein